VTVFGKQREADEESDPVETKSRHSCYAKFSLSATAAETETPLDTPHHTTLTTLHCFFHAEQSRRQTQTHKLVEVKAGQYRRQTKLPLTLPLPHTRSLAHSLTHSSQLTATATHRSSIIGAIRATKCLLIFS
jgi:hypothetical protein